MILKTCWLIDNPCYKYNEKMDGKPFGIIVHSTGANNRNLKRYVQPVKSQSYYQMVIDDIGLNKNGNSWNRLDVKKCVHAFIGLNSKGQIETYNTLPFDLCCWGCASGSKGSFNYNPNACIQFEICEDSLKDEDYFNRAFKEAIEFCAYLCDRYSIPVRNIYSHKEAGKAGYASKHTDCDHWLEKFGKDMAWFRREVGALLDKSHEYYIRTDTCNTLAEANEQLNIAKKAGLKNPTIIQIK